VSPVGVKLVRVELEDPGTVTEKVVDVNTGVQDRSG
jgi:hypothetical protein